MYVYMHVCMKRPRCTHEPASGTCMFVYVCVYVCMCTYIHVCMYGLVAPSGICVCVCMYVCILIYMCVCTASLHPQACLRHLCVFMSMCVYIYINAHTCVLVLKYGTDIHTICMLTHINLICLACCQSCRYGSF